MEHPIKMDDLGGNPTIFGNIHFGAAFGVWSGVKRVAANQGGPSHEMIKSTAQCWSYIYSKKDTTHPQSTPQTIPLDNYERNPFMACW